MVIRMRHTRAHTKNRRSHHGLKGPELVKCSNCNELHRPHHMCLACGFYNGRLVIDMQAKADKRDARMTAKKEAIAGQQQEAAEMEDENAPAPEQLEHMQESKAATMEKTAKNADAATAAQVKPKPQSSK